MPITRQGFRNVGITNISNGVLSRSFGEVSVPTATETTLCSLVVPALKFVRLAGVYGEGLVDGIFRLYVDSTKIWQARNSWSNRNVSSEVNYDAQAGETIYLKVIHQNGVSQPFSGTFWGYENDI
jgi:hypothetical protein